MKKLSFWNRIPVPLQVVILILVSPIAFVLVIAFLLIAFFLLHTAIIEATRPPSPSLFDSIGPSHFVASGETGGFRFYEVYRKYVFDSADFTDNPYFNPVTEEDMKRVRSFTDSYYKNLQDACSPENESRRDEYPYKGWFEIYEQYDFFPECVTPNDYIYRITRSVGKEEFYYFDYETLSLYYIRWE